MKLSVIIPVYKVEKTLDRCVESVLSQDYEDMEIILVDDGSPDLCPLLCDQWAAKDSRIRVVHKPNGGLSDARNAGIDIATGSLITFIDSDDFISPGTYKAVIGAVDDATDIIEYPVVLHYGAEKRQTTLRFDTVTYTDREEYWTEGRGYAHSYACNKIFRSSLFKGVRFPVGKVFEDVQTMPLLLQQARTVKTTDQGLYYYCENPDGITARATGEHLQTLLMGHLTHWDVTADDVYYLHVLNIQLDVCRLLGVRPVMPEKKISSCKNLERRLRRKACMLNVFGLTMLCTIYRTWGWLKRDR